PEAPHGVAQEGVQVRTLRQSAFRLEDGLALRSIIRVEHRDDLVALRGEFPCLLVGAVVGHVLREQLLGAALLQVHDDVCGPVHSRSTVRPVTTWPASTTSRRWRDRKSTRLNSSHVKISYAVFCLKK